MRDTTSEEAGWPAHQSSRHQANHRPAATCGSQCQGALAYQCPNFIGESMQSPSTLSLALHGLTCSRHNVVCCVALASAWPSSCCLLCSLEHRVADLHASNNRAPV
jgi:hypothetical protein